MRRPPMNRLTTPELGGRKKKKEKGFEKKKGRKKKKGPTKTSSAVEPLSLERERREVSLGKKKGRRGIEAFGQDYPKRLL